MPRFDIESNDYIHTAGAELPQFRSSAYPMLCPAASLAELDRFKLSFKESDSSRLSI